MGKDSFREYSPGTVVDPGGRRYAVRERVSLGKFGAVFTAEDEWGNPRILQVLWPFSRSYELVREPWQTQAEELRAAQHPGLVALVDSFEHEGCFHLVHERLDHRLDRAMGGEGWDGSRWVKAVARSVLGALEHSHRRGYIHRNLHPRNVFSSLPFESLDPGGVAASGFLKLGDLAANTLLAKVDVLNAKISRWLVPPEYLSPSECGPMDHRLDIYQAGLLLLSVLRGRGPLYTFEEISVGTPGQDAAALGEPYGPVLARALRLKVAERFGSPLEMWRALSA